MLVAAVACSLLGSLTVVSTIPVVVPGRPHAEPVDYEAVVQSEAYWVSTAQLSCTGDGAGAIAEAAVSGTGAVSIHPYEANIGARALVAAGPRYFPMVRGYLDWYLLHLNRPDRNGVVGTVYDYDYDPVTCTGTPQSHPVTGERPKYDSTDAYAGTFLTLVAEYARAAPNDHDHLRSPAVRADLESIADAVGATLGASGLTAATPTYPAEYLMDNVEAARGVEDYGWLLQSVLGEPAAAQQRLAEARGIRDAIETRLWRGGQTPGMYGWASDQLRPTWDAWFPDSVAQLWPVIDELGDDQRRAGLWAEFDRRWPVWTRSTPEYGSVRPEHDPNASAALAAARIGDREAVDAYLRISQKLWVEPGRPPPWTVDDAGFRALAARTLTTGAAQPGGP